MRRVAATSPELRGDTRAIPACGTRAWRLFQGTVQLLRGHPGRVHLASKKDRSRSLHYCTMQNIPFDSTDRFV